MNNKVIKINATVIDKVINNPNFIHQMKQVANIRMQEHFAEFTKSLDLNNIQYRNPNEEMESLTAEQNEKLDKQTSELISIHYENMKLNAQIKILNKIIDSHDNDISKLQNTISELKSELETVNQTIKDNNKHYWIYTVIAGLVVGVTLHIIEQFF